MKRALIYCGYLAMVMTFGGCKKEESNPSVFSLISVKSGTTDLNKRNPEVTNVSVSLNIIAVFSTNIDYTTVNKTSITLTHDTSHIQLQFVVAGNTLAIVPFSVTGLQPGSNLALTFTNLLKSTQGQALTGDTVIFKTAGVGIDSPPLSVLASQVLYLPFDGTASDLTGHATATFARLSYTTDRFGIPTVAANFTRAPTGGTGNIVELSGNNLINPSMTLSVWLNIARSNYVSGQTAVLGLAADKGYYMEIGGDSLSALNSGPDFIKFATDHKFSFNPLSYRTSVNTYKGLDLPNDTIVFPNPVPANLPVNKLLEDGWHQFVMTYDSGMHVKTFYVDGTEIEQWVLNGPNNGVKFNEMALNINAPGLDPQLAIGYYCSRLNTASPLFNYSTAFNTFVGALDDLRLFNVALTSTQVTDLYTAERPLQ